MDTRDTNEQAELRRAARQLARQLGPAQVPDLDDIERAARLARAVREAGWLELRHDGGNGTPLAGGEEAAIVSDALAASVADVAYSGPVLAADLARRAGCTESEAAVVAFSSALIEAAVVAEPVTSEVAYAVDSGAGIDRAYVLVPDGDGFRLSQVPIAGEPHGADLTRTVRTIPIGSPAVPLHGQTRLLHDDDLAAWTALGLALTSSDLVGLMRGVIDVTVAYAAARKQYGVAIGSFQAMQHLLAEAKTLSEGSLSVALHASWAVDNLPPYEAREAGRVAKAYCARAARTVCETAVQVHGGIGNTWECIVHVYLRRALLSSEWFGDDGEQLRGLQIDRLGAGALVGLS